LDIDLIKSHSFVVIAHGFYLHDGKMCSHDVSHERTSTCFIPLYSSWSQQNSMYRYGPGLHFSDEAVKDRQYSLGCQI